MSNNQVDIQSLPPSGDDKSPVKQALDVVYNSSKTPLPAALSSITLGLLWSKSSKIPKYKPAKSSIIGFGSIFALGGFIIYDGDLVNGAGFTSAWSVLYLMVNGKAAISHLRPGPLLASGLIGFNAVNYGREFFFPSTKQTLDWNDDSSNSNNL